MIYFMYSRATRGGGALVKTTKGGGATTATSSAGGGVSTSTASGGGSSQTSSAGGGTTVSSSISSPTFFAYTSNPVGGPSPEYASHIHAINVTEEMNHSHAVTVPNHSHTVNIPSHTHNFNVPNHSHDVSIPNHHHEIELPDHNHDIDHGIYKLDRLPTAVKIKVDGNVVPHTATSATALDLVPYLNRDDEGKVSRGWHTVEILPNDLGRINAQLNLQTFIQSRGAYTL